MKYSHFFMGEREQRLIFGAETPKPTTVEVKTESPKPGETGRDPRQEAQNKITHAEDVTKDAADSLTKMSKFGEGTVLAPPPSSEAAAKLVAAVKARAEAARARIPGEGTVLAPKLEKGGDTQDWAKSLSPAEKSHIENTTKDMTPDKKAEFNANMNTLSPENVKFMAVEGMAQEKFAKTLGPDLGRKVAQLQQDGKLTSRMMMDGLTPAEAAKIGLKPEEAAALRKAHAEMTATFQAAYPETDDASESKRKSPEDEALMKKLVAERDSAKTNGERIQAEMKIVQQEMKNSGNKIGGMIQLAILAYSLLQSIKDGSYNKLAGEEGQRPAVGPDGKPLAPEAVSGAVPAANREALQKELADRKVGADALIAERTAKINALTLKIGEKEVREKDLKANNAFNEGEIQTMKQDMDKTTDAVVKAQLKNRLDEFTRQIERNNAEIAALEPIRKSLIAEMHGYEADIKALEEIKKVVTGGVDTTAPVNPNPAAAPEAVKSERGTEAATREILSIAAALKKADPQLAANLTNGSIAITTETSTGRMQVAIGRQAIAAIHAMEQKYIGRIESQLRETMTDPAMLIDTLQKIQKAAGVS